MQHVDGHQGRGNAWDDPSWCEVTSQLETKGLEHGPRLVVILGYRGAEIRVRLDCELERGRTFQTLLDTLNGHGQLELSRLLRRLAGTGHGTREEEAEERHIPQTP